MYIASLRLRRQHMAAVAFLALGTLLASAAAMPTNQNAASWRTNAETASHSTDNGLRQAVSQPTKTRHFRRHSTTPRVFCGRSLTDEIAKVCDGKYYHMFPASRVETSHAGASAECCQKPCTLRDLQRYCAEAPAIDNSTTSDEDTSDDTIPTSNQKRASPVEQEEPQSVAIVQTLPNPKGSQIENDIRRDQRHRYEVKTAGLIYTNRAFTPRKKSC